jgi:hypothetical protein
MKSVKLDDIVLTGDEIIREVNVQSTQIQTPGYIYITKSQVSEINNIKFIINPDTSHTQINKPFIHTEGGLITTPVTLKSSTFTGISGSLGSISFNVIEIVSGSTMIIGCTFSDLRMNSGIYGDSGVLAVKYASVTVMNTLFKNIKLSTDAVILGSRDSECEWGLFSVIILRESVGMMKDTMMMNTYGGVIVHGGTANLEGMTFTKVGNEENSKYTSVERHLKCGMFYYFLHLY